MKPRKVSQYQIEEWSTEGITDGSAPQSDIESRYGRTDKYLGGGAFKKVYKAFDVIKQIDVAWNCIDLNNINNDNDRNKIFKECDILSKCHHPNILKIHNQWYNQTTNQLIFITDLLTDGSLSKYFETRPINLIRLKIISKQILNALIYLHSNRIIHRDLKGDNIFTEGNIGKIVLGDLGLATHNVDTTKSIVGTPHWMAPECFNSVLSSSSHKKQGYDTMIDIWSFAMVMLELVTSEIPYSDLGTYPAIAAISSGKKPKTLDKIKNRSLKSFITICLNLNPKLRPTAKELINHPFLYDRITDRILCNKLLINPKQSNNLPPSPMSTINKNLGKSTSKSAKNDKKSNKSDKLNNTQKPSTHLTIKFSKRTPINPTNPNQQNVTLTLSSEEKVIVKEIKPISASTTNITLQIFSCAFKERFMIVDFDYSTIEDTPKDIASEMASAAKLDNIFVAKIENAINKAIRARLKRNEQEKLIKRKPPPPPPKPNTNANANANTNADEKDDEKSNHSDKSIKQKTQQETRNWLKENSLDELIETFQQNGLTMEHLRTIEPDLLKELRQENNWSALTFIKLKKAIKDMKPYVITANSKEFLAEQTDIIHQLYEQNDIVSKDITQIKNAINDLNQSASQCNKLISLNCDSMKKYIEQYKKEHVNQIQSLRNDRTKQLTNHITSLDNIKELILNSKTVCESLINNTNISSYQKLLKMKETQHKLQNDIKKQHYNPQLFEKTDYKLSLSSNINTFRKSLENIIVIKWLNDTFDVKYPLNPLPKGKAGSNSVFGSTNTITQTESETNLVQSPTQQHMDNIDVPQLLPQQSISILPIRLKSFTDDDNLAMKPQKSKSNEHLTIIGDKNRNHDLLRSKTDTVLPAIHKQPQNVFKSNKKGSQSVNEYLVFDQAVTDHSHVDDKTVLKKMNTIPLVQNKRSLDVDNDNIQITINKSIEIKQKSLSPSPLYTKKKEKFDDLLVTGYIRQNTDIFDTLIAMIICNETYGYYHFNYKILKFSNKYHSKNGLRLYDGNTTIKRISGSNNNESTVTNYKWILPDIKPVTHLKHCWRIHIKNPNKGLILIGISEKKVFSMDINPVNIYGIYGIGLSDKKCCWHLNDDNDQNISKHNNFSLKKFCAFECQIDMKLDFIKSELRYCLVTNNDNNNNTNISKNDDEEEAVISNLPLHNNSGWVPYFNFYENPAEKSLNSVGSELRIANCPISWYGRYTDGIFKQTLTTNNS